MSKIPKHIIVLLTVAMTVLWAPAMLALECRVVDPEGAPVAGARVTVIGRSGSMVADSDGRFVVAPEPEPPFVLFVARADGVALRPVTIAEVPPDGVLQVTVEPAGETVTVVSGVVPDLEIPPAVAATILGRADLNQRQPTSLADVLDNIPGASRGGEGRAVVPGLRGLPKHRTLLLLDDGRVVAERRAGASATFLSPETLDEVEVIRGPGSVAYGSDAFGGVIRARSRTAQPGAGTEVRYQLVAATATGELGAMAEVGFDALGGGVLIGAQAKQFDDYESPRGEIFNSGAEERGFRLGFQRALLGGMLRVGWRSDLMRDVGKPAPDSREKRVFYPKEDSHRFNIGYERPGPGEWSRLSASALWDTYRLQLAKESLIAEPQARSESDVDAQDYELRIEAERSFGSTRMVVGANAYGRFDLHASNSWWERAADGAWDLVQDEVSVESARRDTLGVFVGLGRDVGRWNLSGGLRGDVVKTNNRGGYFGDEKTSTSALSGYLAVTYDLTRDLEIALQVSNGFRDPLLSDRYYRGQSGRGFITGNPALEPESSLQWDLAIRRAAGLRSWAVYLFHYEINELIERYKDDVGFYYFRNRGQAELKGIELEGTVVLNHSMVLNLGAQVQRGEVADDGSAMDDIPPYGGFVMLRHDLLPKLSWTLRAAAYGRDDRPGPNEREVPGYGVVDIGVGWKFSDAVELQLLGRNLFDHAYYGSADEDTVLAPGRSLQLSLRGRL